MAVKPEDRPMDARMDPAALYREEIFTDRKVGTIRRLIPVKSDGAADPARSTHYIGEAQMLTAVGALPLSFEIEAQSLDEAVARYGDAAKQAFERALQELQELRRQAASSIVIPQTGAGGLPPGALPGGGKIKLP
jgi:hypothetical protein